MEHLQPRIYWFVHFVHSCFNKVLCGNVKRATHHRCFSAFCSLHFFAIQMKCARHFAMATKTLLNRIFVSHLNATKCKFFGLLCGDHQHTDSIDFLWHAIFAPFNCDFSLGLQHNFYHEWTELNMFVRLLIQMYAYWIEGEQGNMKWSNL